MPDQEPFAGLAQTADVTGLLEELAFRLSDLADSVGNLMPDAAGRLRVAAETVGNIATITTITTVATVSNQTNIGGLAANQHMLAMTQINELGLRQNVVFS
jgi:hypothetical protein